MKIKKLTSLILCIVVVFGLIPTAQATTITSPLNISARVTITDSETGETLTYWADSESINISSISTRSNSNTYRSMASIHLDAEVLGLNDRQSTTNYDDIIMTVGMEYQLGKADRFTTLSMKEIFGSYQETGNFYAEDKVVYWSNSGGLYRGTEYPTEHTFSYIPDNTWCNVISSLPPYVLFECVAKVSGMGGSKNIQVLWEFKQV